MRTTVISHAAFGCAKLFKTTMNDVLGRVVTVRRNERDPGNVSGPHRHPGSHTIGHVLEGTCEVKVGDGPGHSGLRSDETADRSRIDFLFSS
jgi:quercetin dioxygenase-like cupin family protein